MLLILLLAGDLRLRWAETLTRQQAAPSQGRWLPADDVSLYVQEFGDEAAPLLLLVHGTGAWSGTWVSNVDAMVAAGYRVMAIDLPPFGFSGRPANRDYSRAAQARRLLALIDGLHRGPVTLLGHSYGGGPAAEAAMRGPDRVRDLILVDAAIGLSEHAVRPIQPAWTGRLLGVRPLRTALLSGVGTLPALSGFWLRKFVARKEAVTPARTAIYQQPFGVLGFTEGLGDWGYQFAFDDHGAWSSKPQGFRQLRMPLHLVWGELDTITPPAQARQLQGLAPRATLTLLAGVGHIPQIENLTQFNQHLAGLLRELHRPTQGADGAR